MDEVLTTMSHVYGPVFDYDKQKAKKIGILGGISFTESVEFNLENYKLAQILNYKKINNRYVLTFVIPK